ncbi:hypothetical protein FHX47_001220 [Garicola koreensis]|uniref:Alpha-L-glutamate ligase-related protein ATP-grasp domain-containing protein n=1 Tax=Garicola koreensis TaxID=1262554 RepID=A0A7W5TQ19_9MICC|nr:hypothetical protein [Garicola koreensis]
MVPLGATWRVGTGHSIVDNATSGGFYVGIDIDSGKLLGGARNNRREKYERHPFTGFEFTGYTLPGFDSVLAVSKEAHRMVGNPPSVAWDIAMTPEGPLVVEGNTNWLVSLHTTVDKSFGKRALNAFYLSSGLPKGNGWEAMKLRPDRFDLTDATLELQARGLGAEFEKWVTRLARDKGIACKLVWLPNDTLRLHLGGMQWILEHVIYSIFNGPKARRIDRLDVVDAQIHAYSTQHTVFSGAPLTST